MIKIGKNRLDLNWNPKISKISIDNLINCLSITADEARALSKNAGCVNINPQPYIERMFGDIRIHAKAGRTKILVDLVEYSFHFNQSLTHPSYMHLMETMQCAAENQGFATWRLCQKGEYVFVVSWAEI